MYSMYSNICVVQEFPAIKFVNLRGTRISSHKPMLTHDENIVFNHTLDNFVSGYSIRSNIFPGAGSVISRENFSTLFKYNYHIGNFQIPGNNSLLSWTDF